MAKYWLKSFWKEIWKYHGKPDLCRVFGSLILSNLHFIWQFFFWISCDTSSPFLFQIFRRSHNVISFSWFSYLFVAYFVDILHIHHWAFHGYLSKCKLFFVFPVKIQVWQLGSIILVNYNTYILINAQYNQKNLKKNWKSSKKVSFLSRIQKYHTKVK